MRRSDLEHSIRAATEIIRQDQVIIIGSQAVLGSWSEEELPAAATMNDEVDICPLNDDDAESLADELDAAIGGFINPELLIARIELFEAHVLRRDAAASWVRSMNP